MGSMSLYESFLRPLAFRFDPEWVHERAMEGLRRGAFRAPSVEDERLGQTLFGVRFANPLGLAAGFDKNAVAVDHWHQLGFGHVEIGTLTWHAQPGNPRPRLFRLPEDKAIINRMGFNNDGAAVVAERLASARPKIPLGVNLGKSKVTELADAPKDYRASFERLRSFGDYFVVNVSSPNTPGLRSLQERGPLTEILVAIREVDATKPLFVKVAPDLEFSALDDVVAVAHEVGLTGLIATNTTLSREGLKSTGEVTREAGGLSGAPLREKADAFLAHLAGSCDASMVLIGVGGIMTADDLYRKIGLGAHLCQIYTGWIYGGPMTVPNLLQGLVARMEGEGIGSVAALRGALRGRS